MCGNFKTDFWLTCGSRKKINEYVPPAFPITFINCLSFEGFVEIGICFFHSKALHSLEHCTLDCNQVHVYYVSLFIYLCESQTYNRRRRDRESFQPLVGAQIATGLALA